MNDLMKTFSIIHRHSFIYLSKELKKLDIPSGKFMYIVYMCEHPGILQEQLAKDLRIDKGSVAKTVAQLIDDGYLYKIPDSKDKRAYNLFPSELSKKIYPQIITTIDELNNQLTMGMSEVEKLFFKELLHKSLSNVLSLGKNHNKKSS